jgi:hypothetical protein
MLLIQATANKGKLKGKSYMTKKASKGTIQEVDKDKYLVATDEGDNWFHVEHLTAYTRQQQQTFVEGGTGKHILLTSPGAA